jgi:photosystem II stability/assembly factor-like uncharacterized protein
LRVRPVIVLAVDPQKPSTLYAGTDSGLFKSADGAAQWIEAYSGIGQVYVRALMVDSQNPDTVYAGTDRGLFKSMDGAASWSRVLGNSGVAVLDPRNPNTLYAGIPGGLLKSTDGGGSWSAPLQQRLLELGGSTTHTCDDWSDYFAEAMGRDAPAAEDIGCFPDGNRDALITVDQYIAALQVFAFRQPNAADFGLIGGVGALVADPQNPDTLYAEAPTGPARRLRIFKSTDGGVSWNVASAGLPADAQAGSLTIDPKNPITLYTFTTKGLYRSADGAESWNPAGAGLPTQLSLGIGNVAVVNPQDPNTIYAATSSGVFKSVDGAGSWSSANSGLAASNVSVLAVDAQARGTLFAGASGGSAGIYKSTDGGTNWTNIGPPVMTVGVNALAVNPQNPAILYADCVFGDRNFQQLKHLLDHPRNVNQFDRRTFLSGIDH